MKFLELTLYATANDQKRVLINLDNISCIREKYDNNYNVKYTLIITISGEELDVEESFDEINELLKTFY